MSKGFEDYREIIDSIEENGKLLSVLKKSCTDLISEIHRMSFLSEREKLTKKSEYLEELYYFGKILLKIEENQYKHKKNLRESSKHNIKDFLKWLGMDSDAYEPDEISGVAVDSRLVSPGNVFFALQGSKENGEKYIKNAIENGATYVFASKNYEYHDHKIIKVDDTLEALKKIAIAYRKSMACKVLAITGSVGKTTCKNFAYSILSEKFRTEKTFGNYNTVTGISMSILDMPKNTEVMVLELGVDSVGDMEDLIEVAEPDYGIITNISESHLERFGSKKAIFDEKIKLAGAFKKGSVLVVNGESEFLDVYQNDAFKVVKLFEDEKKYQASKKDGVDSALLKNTSLSSLGTSFSILQKGKQDNFAMKLFGKHLAFNAALAILVCEEMGASWNLAKLGILKTRSEAMRFDLSEIDGFRIVNDAYNSSFKSLEASIRTARELTKGKLYVLIGDIKEIGDDAKKKHAEIGAFLSDMGIDCAMFYGEMMAEAKKAYKGKEALHFDDLNEVAVHVLKNISREDTFLVKASRALELERVSDLVLMNIMRSRFVDILLDVSKDFLD
ncbi:MAG: UDP-N-acetylmuramoyl-tripeptide--D-alanyl-D-alanine ligase [Bacillota bacterium]|nr:UDP-N-acetylmuramoyl-tripeptide--D-alanyl-D-alanine ligase [Bacillota bacterium]